jgi:hypothetical protein
MGICCCLPGPQTSSHQAEVLLIEYQPGNYPETGFEEIRRTDERLSSTLPRSGVLARDNFRLARDSGAIDFKLRMVLIPPYNGTSGRAGKFTSTPRPLSGKVPRLSATLVCGPNLLTGKAIRRGKVIHPVALRRGYPPYACSRERNLNAELRVRRAKRLFSLH